MIQFLEAPHPLSERQFCASRYARAAPCIQGKYDDFSTKFEDKKNSKDDRTLLTRQCQNCFDRLHTASLGLVYLPKFSIPADSGVGQNFEQPLVQVAVPLELVLTSLRRDLRRCNLLECPNSINISILKLTYGD